MRLYYKSPIWLPRLLSGLFHRIIWLAKLAVTREHPTKQVYDMNFYLHVVH